MFPSGAFARCFPAAVAATALLPAVAGAKTLSDAFFGMAEICADPEGAPQRWRDEAAAQGWEPVPEEMFGKVAAERAWPLALMEYWHVEGQSPVGVSGFQSSLIATLDRMKSDQALREAEAARGNIVPNGFYMYRGNPSLSVQLPLDDFPPGSGWPLFAAECDIIYNGEDIAPFDPAGTSFEGEGEVETRSDGAVKKTGFFEFFEGETGSISVYSIEPEDEFKLAGTTMRAYLFDAIFKLPQD